jgi:hypothetical protein
MQVFISYNKKDKTTARLLAMALVQQGSGVWFDEWHIAPGESITGGIENGLHSSNVFVLVWSAQAATSKWVGTEVRVYLRRRVDDDSLRIVPILLDDTALPVLVADYRGFSINDGISLPDIAAKITGEPPDIEIATMLQRRLNQLCEKHAAEDIFPYMVCPMCASRNLKRTTATDYERDKSYYVIECKDCGWGDWTQ